MLGLLGSALILLGTSAIGIILAKRIEERGEQLKELEKILMMLKNEIMYRYTPMPEALGEIASRVDEPYTQIFMRASMLLQNNRVDSIDEALKIAVEENINEVALTDEDIDILIDFGKSIGMSDIDGQDKVISYTEAMVKNARREAEDRIRKDVKVYKALGVASGLAIIIIMA